MAIAHVQAVANNSLSAASLSVTISATGAGNSLVVMIGIGSTTVTVTSIDGMTETLLLGPVNGGSDRRAYMYYETNIPGGTTVITVNLSAATAINVHVKEFSGGHLTALPDTGGAENSNASASADPASVSTSPDTNENNELLVAFINTGAGQTWVDADFDADYVRRTNAGRGAFEDRILATAGADTASFDLDAATNWVCLLGAFREAAAAGGPPIGGLSLMGVGR